MLLFFKITWLFNLNHNLWFICCQILRFLWQSLPLDLQACSSAQGRSSTANSRTKVAVLLGMVASHCFLHTTLSLASDQTLKDPRGTNMEVRRVDLANWALWTLPKFTTRVKYQFHKGFWPNPRSRNPKHPSLPYL